MLKAFVVFGGVALVSVVTLVRPVAAGRQQLAAVANAPVYSAGGALRTPKNYREWQYLTTGIDMSYTASGDAEHHSFDNVFVNPESYAAFKRTGTWPEGTTFVLEVRGADSPVSINKRGHTQSGDVAGLEIHVRDRGEWKFYEGDLTHDEATFLPRPAACYSCHEQHGAVATTFVQFYPTLLPIAKAKGTLSPEYVKESAAARK